MTINVRSDRFEVAVAAWFWTFGMADRTLRYRVEPDVVVWSKLPGLGTLRFREAWESMPRESVDRFGFVPLTSGSHSNIRGMNTLELWFELVIYGVDGSERQTGHRLPSAAGTAMARLLQWAHHDGVPRSGGAERVFRTSARAPERLAVVLASGDVVRLG